MPYHVRVTRKSNPSYDETRLDLSQDELEQRFLAPYKEGRPIVVGGMSVSLDDIQRIRITETTQSGLELLPIVQAERSASGAAGTGISDEWYIADRGRDVTDAFITAPPGRLTEIARPGARAVASPPDPSKVFVVHGRNARARDAMFVFLRSLSLQPIEWIEAVRATGKASPYIGEILDAAFSRAMAVVVLLTPDDEARLRGELQKPDDPPHERELTGQARPNVLFEAGLAMACDEDRTVLVELGHVRPFSDVAGRHAVRIDDSGQRRQELAQRLETAGCSVNITGIDWHNAGQFDAALNFT